MDKFSSFLFLCRKARVIVHAPFYTGVGPPGGWTEVRTIAGCLTYGLAVLAVEHTRVPFVGLERVFSVKNCLLVLVPSIMCVSKSVNT